MCHQVLGDDLVHVVLFESTTLITEEDFDGAFVAEMFTRSTMSISPPAISCFTVDGYHSGADSDNYAGELRNRHPRVPGYCDLVAKPQRRSRNCNLDDGKHEIGCAELLLFIRNDRSRFSERKRQRDKERAQIEDMQRRFDVGNAMTVRRRTVEHTFGTIKAWMDHTHFCA